MDKTVQQFTSNIMWTCEECGKVNTQSVPVPDLNFAAEKSSDMGVDDVVQIVCDQCELVYEGHVYVSAHDTHFEIEEPHRLEFSGDVPMYEPDEDDYFPPDDPYSIIKEALKQLAVMVGASGPPNDLQFVNRLIFVGAISSFEAYLCDTLIGEVRRSSEVLSRLTKSNRLLGSLKFSAAELAEDPEAVEKRIVMELRKVLYHNLKMVTALYKNAFGVSLTPSKSESDTLFLAMSLRHDCVHRNGKDRLDNKLDDFTDQYVHLIVSTIEKVADGLEQEITKDLPF
ncbi:MAG: hypothetical protein P8Q48_22950 [Paracoccaceae bacterium]|nr:hypothetical protein [Paracoccaceae bacterium]